MEQKGESETYEVMYYNGRNGFQLPVDFVEKVFEKYPPDTTELGTQLFTPVKDIQFIDRTRSIWLRVKNEGHNNTHDNTQYDYFEVYKKEPYVNGYMLCHTRRYVKVENGKYKRDKRGQPAWYQKNVKGYVTKDNKNYYDISGYISHNEKWRIAPEVIAMAKQEGLINEYSDLSVAKVPIGFEYDIGKYAANCREFVSISFPYRKVIGEFLEYVKTGSMDCMTDNTKRLINGELDIKDI